jgi:hypothetical protein
MSRMSYLHIGFNGTPKASNPEPPEMHPSIPEEDLVEQQGYPYQAAENDQGMFSALTRYQLSPPEYLGQFIRFAAVHPLLRVRD